MFYGKVYCKKTGIQCGYFFFVTFIIYALECNLPTSYVEQTARELATRPGATKSAQEWIDELNAQYGMDKGIVQGYFIWLGNAVQGNFGDSWSQTMPVLKLLTSVSGTVS